MKLKNCSKFRYAGSLMVCSCLLLCRVTPVYAADPYVSTSNLVGSTVTIGNTDRYTSSIRDVGTFISSGITCYADPSVVSSNSDCTVLRALVSCSVDGTPYHPGMRVAGGALLYLSLGGANGGRELIESGVNEYGSLYPPGTGAWNGVVAGIHIPTGFVLPSTITYECRTDVSASGFPLHDSSVGYVGTLRRSITFSSLNGITISEPRPMVGPPGREVSTDFTVSVSSDVSFPFKWEVTAPCSDWNPYLKVNGAGEAIGVGEVGVGSTLGRETPMTAYFTPTEMGSFSCPATMTFYID